MMKRMVCSALLALGLSAGSLGACPACKDQVPTQRTATGEMLVDPAATQRAYALSIYVLLSAVYGLPALLGLVMWRAMSSAQARQRRQRAARTAASMVPPGTPVREDERRETGLPGITWSPREEAGS